MRPRNNLHVVGGGKRLNSVTNTIRRIRRDPGIPRQFARVGLLPDPQYYYQYFQPSLPPQQPPAPEFLYHYTDERGFGSIINAGVIRQSNGDSGKCPVYGTGVYFTALPPGAETGRILMNNYGYTYINPNARNLKKTQFVFQLTTATLPSIQRVRGDVRDIWICRQDLYLSQLPFIAYERDCGSGVRSNNHENAGMNFNGNGQENRGGFQGNYTSFQGNYDSFQGNNGSFLGNNGSFQGSNGSFQGNNGSFQGNYCSFQGNNGSFQENYGGSPGPHSGYGHRYQANSYYSPSPSCGSNITDYSARNTYNYMTNSFYG